MRGRAATTASGATEAAASLLSAFRTTEAAASLLPALRTTETTASLLPALWTTETTASLLPALRTAEAAASLLPAVRTTEATATLLSALRTSEALLTAATARSAELSTGRAWLGFVRCELAVLVAIEFEEVFAGGLDFSGVDGEVVVHVDGGGNGMRRWTSTAPPAGPAKTAGPLRAALLLAAEAAARSAELAALLWLGIRRNE